MTFPDTKFQRLLAKLDACYDAREWVGRKSLKTAWETCPRVDWLLWLHSRLDPTPWAYAGLAGAWASDAAFAAYAASATYAAYAASAANAAAADDVRAVLFCPEVGA